jgi:hypothetical protein
MLKNPSKKDKTIEHTKKFTNPTLVTLKKVLTKP